MEISQLQLLRDYGTENTLTEAEIEQVSKSVIDRVESATGGILRS